MRTRGAILLATVVTGLALGFTVANIGFGDYAELNRMFTFQDLRMRRRVILRTLVPSCVGVGSTCSREPCCCGG